MSRAGTISTTSSAPASGPVPAGVRPPNRPLAIELTGLLLFGAIMGVGAYTLLGLVQGAPFGWGQFAVCALLLELIDGLFLLAVWRHRQHLSARFQVLALDWAGTSLWYWSLGPLYQLWTMNLNSAQMRLDAFAFFWEVPVIGGVSFLLGQLLFKPVHQYLRTGQTTRPDRLYHLVDQFPMNVVLRTVNFTIVGYVVGAWQLHHYTGLPPEEVVKDIGNGVVLSLFLALFYSLTFRQLLGWIRTKLRRQYHLQVPIRKFYRQVLSVVALVVLGSLALLVLMFVQSFQVIIENRTANQVRTEMASAVAEVGPASSLESQKHHFQFGTHGQAWVLPVTASLPVPDVSPDTATQFVSLSNGTLIDRHDQTKVIVFQTYGQQKLVSLIYPADFLGELQPVAVGLLSGGLFIALLTLAIITIFNRILTSSISTLIAAVRQAQTTGSYIAPAIHTGDEFETLSDAYETFIAEKHEQAQQVQDERARLEASIESLNLGFVMIGSNSQVVLTNKPVTNVLGLKNAGSLTIASISKRFRESRVDLAAACRQILSGQEDRLHWEVTTTNNKIIHVFLAPIQGKQSILGAVLLMQDITEETILARSKDEFFSIASHELRTPLTAIRGNTGMIQQYFPEHMKDQNLAEMIEDIHGSSVRLIQIVNDFLDLSRLEQGRMAYKTTAFDVHRVIEGVLYEMQAVAAKKGITIKSDEPALDHLPQLWADQDRTKQIIYNLVGNALKFTDSGSITISAKEERGLIKVSVTDTGRGIAEADQKLLFRKFQQASNSLITRDVGGTGLGLYISKMLSEEMGGTLKLESSKLGSGTTFSFTLPLATPERMKAAASASHIDTRTGQLASNASKATNN